MESNRQQPQESASLRGLWPAPQLAEAASFLDVDTSGLTALDPVAHDVKTVLFVDPAIELQQAAHDVLKGRAHITVCSTFLEARTALFAHAPDLLITGVRLRAHNGLHLVHLAAMSGSSTRSIVFAGADDYPLAREIHEAGAFFVPADTLLPALTSYLAADLPPRDRRGPASALQQDAQPGGRRYTDK
jgi:DNA-binding NtrC family response regulator